jgi:branched-chain amino acid aminotransferase
MCHKNICLEIRYIHENFKRELHDSERYMSGNREVGIALNYSIPYLRNPRMNDLNNLISLNGKLIEPHIPVATVQNRSLRYGDGVFETMYWDGEKIQNLEFHLDRLFQGLVVLQFDLSAGFTRNFISEEIRKLCIRNSTGIPARARLTIFREDGFLLLPSGNKPEFIIETSLIQDETDVPLRLTIFKNESKSTGILSNLKTNNYLLNIAAIQYANANRFDDALILNSRGNICEASSSNLFLIQKGILFTPALSQGCVAGIKRRELLETLPALGYQIEETIITKEMVFEMEEIFLTNAIRGIRPVICIDSTYYSRELTEKIRRLLREISK